MNRASTISYYVGVLLTLLMAASPLSLYAQKPDRAGPPELGAPPAVQVPPIQHLTLSNGLRVLLVEKHEVPLVQVNLRVMAGAVMDPTGKGGLASLTADMLDEGAGKRDALELADAIDFLGANLSTSAGMHTAVVNLNTPLNKLEQALPLMADIALRPTFPKTELNRLRNERLTTLIQWHDEARAIASVLFDRTLFGPDHPYGRPTLGNETSLKVMSTKDLKKFHRSYYRPNNAALIVVGDVTAESIQPLLEQAFGTWRQRKVSTPSWPETEQVSEGRIYLVDKPEAPQSEILIGRIGAPRKTEDYYPLVVMNTVLGGAFTSRLNQNLREEHGYTYGAGSGFGFRLLPGPFRAGSAVQTEVTDKAVDEFIKEFQGILEPIPEEELAKAKNYVALRFPQRFETVARTAGQLADLIIYDLPDDYFNSYTGDILGVTQEAAQRVAQKYIDPQGMAIIVVGDREKVEEGLKALDYGPAEVYSIQDVLGEVPTLPSGE